MSDRYCGDPEKLDPMLESGDSDAVVPKAFDGSGHIGR